MWRICLIGCVLAAAGAAFAQTVVKANQGQPGTQGAWPVVITSSTADGGTISGALATYPRACSGSTSKNINTVVGGTSAPVPATPTANRIYVVLCNSAQNASTATLKCRADGVSPTFAAGNAGDVLLFGDCITYSADSTNVINCIADSAGRNVTTYECVPG